MIFAKYLMARWQNTRQNTRSKPRATVNYHLCGIGSSGVLPFKSAYYKDFGLDKAITYKTKSLREFLGLFGDIG